MKLVNVELEKKKYPIYFYHDQIDGEHLARHCRFKKVLIVTNDVVAPLYLDDLQRSISSYLQLESFILSDGEQEKNLVNFEQIIVKLLDGNYGRDTTLIALGGGVIGDMTGFAASCYQRGVDLIHIPTTLLAQVDASIGGKTAINHGLGKNMIGTFYQPQSVHIAPSFLLTLPEREYISGLAEVVKYALLGDVLFFEWLEQSVDLILNRDLATVSEMIERCCRMKAEIVAQDETENNIRALLNLGHTFGHAIETHTQYKTYLHGEAVAIGLGLAADTSKKLSFISDEDVNRIKSLLTKMQLPLRLQLAIDPDDFLVYMRRDKKNLLGQIRLVLLDSIGEAKLVDKVDEELLKNLIKQV